MKKALHPDNYRPVVFQDLNNGTTFLTRSTVDAEDTITLDGVDYPLVKVHISSSSHPFFTGEERIVDIEGRVDKFKARAAAGEAAMRAGWRYHLDARRLAVPDMENRIGAAGARNRQMRQSRAEAFGQDLAGEPQTDHVSG